MLAEAGNNASTGSLTTVGMTDKDPYELKIAGMLHDCAKSLHSARESTRHQAANIYDA